MFDDLNKKKEDVEDIFADTETEESVKDNSEEKPISPAQTKTDSAPVEPSSEKVEIEEEHSELDGGYKKKKILKVVIIAALLILVSVAAYFIYNSFIKNNQTEIEDNLVVVENEIEEEEENWPEFVDPNSIINEEEEEEEVMPVEEEEEVIPEEEEEEGEEEIINPIWLDRIDSIKLGILDSDGDGLSDLVEEYISTDASNTDTDGDTYSDLEEIINGYNPLGEGVLPDSFLITYYQNEFFEFLYPAQATIDFDQGRDSKSVSISLPSNNIVKNQIGIYIQENIWQADVFSWYGAQFPNAARVENTRIINHPNLGAGIIDEDGLAIYFTSADYSEIITISWSERLELDEYNYIYIVMSDLRINN
jgi:hypothetical protein